MRVYLLVIINFCLSTILLSQEKIVVRDIGLRTGIKYNLDLKKDFDLGFMQDIRTFDNSTKVESFHTESVLGYKINKNFKISGGIRYIRNRKSDNSFYNDLRTQYDFSFKKKFENKFAFQYRLRYQYVYANLFSFNKWKYDPSDNKSNFRNKIEVNYKLNKKHKPAISYELFREYKLFRRPRFNQMRINLEDKIDVGKNELMLRLSYERSWDNVVPLNFYFLSVYYEFD